MPAAVVWVITRQCVHEHSRTMDLEPAVKVGAVTSVGSKWCKGSRCRKTLRRAMRTRCRADHRAADLVFVFFFLFGNFSGAVGGEGAEPAAEDSPTALFGSLFGKPAAVLDVLLPRRCNDDMRPAPRFRLVASPAPCAAPSCKLDPARPGYGIKASALARLPSPSNTQTHPHILIIPLHDKQHDLANDHDL